MRRFSKRCWIILFVLALAACKSADKPQPASSSSPAASPAASVSSTPAQASALPRTAAGTEIDPCTLLAPEDLKAVQGEDLKQATRSDQPSPDYIMSQCYFLMTTPVNSVVVNVTAPKAGGKRAKELWKDMFEEGKGEEGEGEEGEKAARPEEVRGLGGDALWIGSRVGGALYVLKKDLIFRISVGGAGDMKAKEAKSKTLAMKALARIK